MSFIPLITGEHQNDGEVNSISEMERPVQNVLGGMRVQRMSLVQSLRQYAFVYRGEWISGEASARRRSCSILSFP